MFLLLYVTYKVKFASLSPFEMIRLRFEDLKLLKWVNSFNFYFDYHLIKTNKQTNILIVITDLVMSLNDESLYFANKSFLYSVRFVLVEVPITSTDSLESNVFLSEYMSHIIWLIILPESQQFARPLIRTHWTYYLLSVIAWNICRELESKKRLAVSCLNFKL